jgi:glycosyltransferase involved in cell wall biosynthesis
MHKPTVHILLATYNGAQFLTEQLESIARQTHSAWTLTISDDGSTDNTLALVAEFAARITQPLTVLQGPRQKSSTRNFCHLIQNAPDAESSDLYAFCDQDDVWLDNKLERAVEWHEQQQTHAVRLYCSRTQFVDEQLNPIGLSPGIQRPPSFGNALVQNIASGNTMVFNQAVLKGLQKVRPEHSVWHDWTTYLVATALGGLVHFQDSPSLLYRQHQRNVVGSNNNLNQLVRSITLSIRGRYQCRISKNQLAIKDMGLQENNKFIELSTLIKLIRISSNPLKRAWLFNRSKLHRQGRVSHAILWVAALLGKL